MIIVGILIVLLVLAGFIIAEIMEKNDKINTGGEQGIVIEGTPSVSDDSVIIKTSGDNAKWEK